MPPSGDSVPEDENTSTPWSSIGLPKEIPLRWFKGANSRPAPTDSVVIAAEQRNIDLYLRNGLIPKPIDAAAIVDPSFNKAVLSGAQEASLR